MQSKGEYYHARKDFEDVLAEIIREEKVDVGIILPRKLGFYSLEDHFNYLEETYVKCFFNPISRDIKKLELFDNVIRFYYFNLKRPSKQDVSPDLKLIIIFSIIEKLMSDNQYITFIDWLKNKFVSHEVASIENSDKLENLSKIYFNEYGSAQKVKKFLLEYYPKDDLEELSKGLERWDEGAGKFTEADINDLIQFVLDARNDFIHSAVYTHILTRSEFEKSARCYTHYDSSTLHATAHGKRTWNINNRLFSIENILFGFERALIKYFLS